MRIIGMILLFLIGMIGILLFAVWYTHMLVVNLVVKKHKLIDHITQTGDFPEAWANPKRKIRKLNKLIQYAKRTRMINDEATRSDMINKLNDVKSRLANEKALKSS